MKTSWGGEGENAGFQHFPISHVLKKTFLLRVNETSDWLVKLTLEQYSLI